MMSPLLVRANSLKDVQDCEHWFMGMAKIMSQSERDADLAKNHVGEEIDTAHDLEVNDPSDAATELHTTEFFHQNWLVVRGVNPHINENVSKSFDKILKNAPKNAEAILQEQESKELLAIHNDRYQPKVENGLSTVNSNTEYCGISDRSHGYCWGYATMVENFHTLAFYDETLPKLKTTAEYLKKIDSIIAGEATVIPGFKNLDEFSKIPEYELYLKLNAMEIWKTRAVRMGSIHIFKNATKPMTITEQSTLVGDLQKRLDRNEMPKIIFSSLVPSSTIMGMNTDIHVVLANGVEKLANGNTRIHVWDINFYAKTLIKEPKYLEITPDGNIHYAPWYEPKVAYADKSDLVASVQIAPEHDAEQVGRVRSLKKFRKKNPKYFQK